MSTSEATRTTRMPTPKEVLARQKEDAERARARAANPAASSPPTAKAAQATANLQTKPGANLQTKPGLPAAASDGKAASSPQPATDIAVSLPDVDGRSSVQRYLDEISGSFIAGRLIKFNKNGEFVTADDDKPVSDDVDFLALCAETWVGWIKFNEGGPPERIGGVLYDGFVMPPRAGLGDDDPASWPLGLSGEPQDPWQHQVCLVLQRTDTRELYTFATSSVTGRRAVGNLLRHYDRRRKSDPGELPVVRLKPGGFNHRDPRVGWVYTPTFVVVGRGSQDTAAKPDTSIQAQLNDDLPFFPD